MINIHSKVDMPVLSIQLLDLLIQIDIGHLPRSKLSLQLLNNLELPNLLMLCHLMVAMLLCLQNLIVWNCDL